MAKRTTSRRNTARAAYTRPGTPPLFVPDDSLPRLDARTRAIGLAGIARARQVLAAQAERNEQQGAAA